MSALDGAPAGDGPRSGEGADSSRGYLERQDDADLIALVTRPDLPPAFDRWHVTLAPGAERETGPGEWAGTLVLVEAGRLDVDCCARGRQQFEAGDLLVLGWLPLRTLRNPGPDPVRLVAVRRRGDHPTAGLLRVIGHIRR